MQSDSIIYLNTGANICFKLNVILSHLVDSALKNFSDIQILDTLLDNVFSSSQQFYQQLYYQLSAFFILLSLTGICYQMFIKQYIKIGILQFVKMILIITFGSLWLKNANMIISTINHISHEVQHTIMTTTSAYTDISSDQTTRQHMNYLRHQFYELTLLKPYLAMNYGTVDINKIGLKRVEKFLTLDITSEHYIEQVKMNIEQETKEYHNIYMQSKLLDLKFIISFVSPILTLLVAIPFFILSTSNLVIDILILIFIIIFPFFLVLSLLNLFSDKVLKGCVIFLSLFVIKTLFILLTIILFITIQILSKIIPLELGITHYLLTSILMIVLNIITYKNKDILYSMTSGGLIYIKSNANQELSKIQALLNITKGNY